MSKEQVYSDADVQARLRETGLTNWYLEDGWLRRMFYTEGWPTTLMLVNAVGFVCEAAYHHADLAVTWGKVWVKLKTHSAGGITDKDFELARKIEELALWRPAPGGALTGHPKKFVTSGDPPAPAKPGA
jgi:4a-hydroxytetrahydrobiopterin dehydratase